MDTRRGTGIQVDTKKDTVKPIDGWGMRKCQFCGCNTNAHYRACCNLGRLEDHAKSKAESAEPVDPHRFDCDWLGHRNEILEEAAKVCEDLPSFNPDDPGESYAKAVRALKT